MRTEGEALRADARRNIDAILVAARDVFAEDSSAQLGVVAAHAGVHRVTLYRHFRSREALIAALHDASIDEVHAAVLEADPEAGDPLSEIEALVRRVYEINVTWRTYGWAPAYSPGTPQRRRRDEIGAIVAQLFAAAQQQGCLRSDLDNRELLAAWGGPVIYLTGNIADGHWTLDEVVDYTMRLLKPASPGGSAA